MIDRCGIEMSRSKVSRLVRQYQRQVAANGWSFAEFFANQVRLGESQRRRVLTDPELAKAIRYADPTGETAVRRVMRGGGG